MSLMSAAFRLLLPPSAAKKLWAVDGLAVKKTPIDFTTWEFLLTICTKLSVTIILYYNLLITYGEFISFLGQYPNPI